MSTQDRSAGITSKGKSVDERLGNILWHSRVRVLATIAIAVFASSTIVAAMTTAEPQPSSAIFVDADDFPVSSGVLDSWPAPNAPLDETPITPVESAGAPMFP